MFVYKLSACRFDSVYSSENTSAQDFHKVCWPEILKKWHIPVMPATFKSVLFVMFSPIWYLNLAVACKRCPFLNFLDFSEYGWYMGDIRKSLGNSKKSILIEVFLRNVSGLETRYNFPKDHSDMDVLPVIFGNLCITVAGWFLFKQPFFSPY